MCVRLLWRTTLSEWVVSVQKKTFLVTACEKKKNNPFCHQFIWKFSWKPYRFSQFCRFMSQVLPRVGVRGVGGGGTQIWKWYICATEGLKYGTYGAAPYWKRGGGGFQNWSTREKRGLGAKNNKEIYIFFGIWGSFELHMSKNWSL